MLLSASLVILHIWVDVHCGPKKTKPYKTAHISLNFERILIILCLSINDMHLNTSIKKRAKIAIDSLATIASKEELQNKH